MPLRRLRERALKTWRQIDGPIGLVMLAGSFMYAGAVLKDYVGGQYTINALMAVQHESNANIKALTVAVDRMSGDQHAVLQALAPVTASVNEIKETQKTNRKTLRKEMRQAVDDASKQTAHEAAKAVVGEIKEHDTAISKQAASAAVEAVRKDEDAKAAIPWYRRH